MHGAVGGLDANLNLAYRSDDESSLFQNATNISPVTLVCVTRVVDVEPEQASIPGQRSMSAFVTAGRRFPVIAPPT